MSNRRRLGTWVVAALALPVALTLLWWFLPVGSWLSAGVDNIAAMGITGAFLYLALYIVLASLSVPTTPLNIGAGVIFTFLSGYAVALAGGLTAATLVFLFARHVFSDRVRSKLERYDYIETLSTVVKDESFKIVFLTRLNPLLPASVKNYTFALAGVPLRTYVIATFCGQVPITAIHVYLGWVGGAAMMTQHGQLDGLNTWLLVGGVVLSIALFAVIGWYAHRTFQQRLKTVS